MRDAAPSNHVHLHELCDYDTTQGVMTGQPQVRATCLECGEIGHFVLPKPLPHPLWPRYIIEALKAAQHKDNCNTMLVVASGDGTWEDGVIYGRG